METTTYYSAKCLAFAAAFAGMENVITFNTEIVSANCAGYPIADSGELFEGTAYLDKREFVCVGEWDDGEFTVYINNPHSEVTPDGCPMFTDEHPQQQFIFGRYNSFKRAVNKAVTIVKARKYPKPIEIY